MIIPPDAPQGAQPAAAPTGDPLREAARDLHEQFLAEMLKQARLTEAFGAGEGGADLGQALASVAARRIADDVAAAQPALTDSLYEALRRAGRDAT